MTCAARPKSVTLMGASGAADAQSLGRREAGSVALDQSVRGETEREKSRKKEIVCRGKGGGSQVLWPEVAKG